MARSVLFKDLLRQKHWQTYRMFCIQYDKAARKIDKSLVGEYPSRAQLHRWQSGDLKGLPYTHHCQVLEAMFPGVTAEQLFAPVADNGERAVASGAEPVAASALLDSVRKGIAVPAAPHPNWGKDSLVSGPNSSAPQVSFPLPVAQRIDVADVDIAEIAMLAGNLIELEMECSIDIDVDGWASVTYRHHVMNLTNRPVKRMTREQWFETTAGRLTIESHPNSDRKVHIQRIHDTPNMSKFACQFSPAIEPGEVATISYTSRGGRFVHDHYWRQSAPRYTRHFTLNIRHRGVSMLLNCTAIEERTDGSEISAIEDLVCNDEDGDALITLTRNYLQPSQVVTVRWEVSRAAS